MHLLTFVLNATAPAGLSVLGISYMNLLPRNLSSHGRVGEQPQYEVEREADRK